LVELRRQREIAKQLKEKATDASTAEEVIK
jgi:hypothetical protein